MKDKQIEKLIKEEEKRQKSVVNLIASENIVSDDVLKALGSKLTNKYAEGYPGKRYYGGNQVVDKVELLCIARALKLFKLKGDGPFALKAQDQISKDIWHVNVQLLSGSPANFALYSALVPVGGKIMGMKLTSGGHLTHGHPLSMTGKLWKPLQFELDKNTEVIDYEALKSLAITEKPDIIVCGFTAYPRIVDFKKFREIADSCGALLHVDMSHFAGLVAGGAYPTPFPYADTVMTTTHKSLRGPRQAILFVKKDAREFDKKLDKMVIPGLFGGPHENNIAAVAVALAEAMKPEFKKYAKQVVKNAKVLAKELQKLGWHIISGGTDSHLILMDTWMEGKGVPGKIASDKLEKAGIIVNMNTIPGDPRGVMDPSGIRLGTCAETTRGKKEADMVKLAVRMDNVLRGK